MRYLFSGGGSGGHIFPAIAIAEEVRKNDPEAEFLFIGAKGRIEEKIVPSNNFRLETIDISGIDREKILKNTMLPVKFLKALMRCRKLIRNFAPDVAIGTGGFVCGPIIYTANLLGIPTLIQEGNSFAGKTIKFLSGKADKVVINFEETKKYLKRKDNVIIIPHPIRSSLSRTDKSVSTEYFGLDSKKKTIFIFGGSQGARGINENIDKIIADLHRINVNVIWQTGKNDNEKYKAKYKDLTESIKILEFIDNIDKAYSSADILICRAGITSIMEIAYMRSVSILIPLPTSAENHQELNARSVEKRGGAKVVLQKEASEKLLPVITELLNDEDIAENIKINAGSIADPEAAKKIAGEVMKLATNRKK